MSLKIPCMSHIYPIFNVLQFIRGEILILYSSFGVTKLFYPIVLPFLHRNLASISCEEFMGSPDSSVQRYMLITYT